MRGAQLTSVWLRWSDSLLLSDAVGKQRLSRPALGLPRFQEPSRISLLGVLKQTHPLLQHQLQPCHAEWEPTSPGSASGEVLARLVCREGRAVCVHHPGAGPGADPFPVSLSEAAAVRRLRRIAAPATGAVPAGNIWKCHYLTALR